MLVIVALVGPILMIMISIVFLMVVITVQRKPIRIKTIPMEIQLAMLATIVCQYPTLIKKTMTAMESVSVCFFFQRKNI